jgi:hypothetical protein
MKYFFISLLLISGVSYGQTNHRYDTARISGYLFITDTAPEKGYDDAYWPIFCVNKQTENLMLKELEVASWSSFGRSKRGVMPPITIHSIKELESLAAYFEYHEAFADSPYYELYGHKDTLSNEAVRIYGQASLDLFFSQLGYESKADSFGSKILYIKPQ